MASWMIHLRIADALLTTMENSRSESCVDGKTKKFWKDLDETAFVVGNIAPDSGVPNEDWSKFTPDGVLSHYKIPSESGMKEIDLERFVAEYLSPELLENYSKKEHSFFAGYWTHLVTDVLWAQKIWKPCKEKYRRINGLPESMTEDQKQSMIWTIKADWYDLDFLYLKKHPDFRGFRIYREAVGFKNEFMDIFSEDAFDNRREYITGFYLAGRDNLDREYPYLTEERAEEFVQEAAEEIGMRWAEQ